jgi:F5/8 type C domain
MPLWVLAVVVAGILAGVGAIVLPDMLRGSGPSSAASTAPSAMLQSGPASSSGAGASGAAPTAASAAPASAAPSAPAAKPLHLTAATGSSVLGGNTGKYGAGNAIDGNAKTSWAEGSTTEKGQWIEVGFAPSTVIAVSVRNGFDASTALYKGNLRLKDVQISVDGGTPATIRLKDTPNAQRVDLPPTPSATRLRITIVSTYPSVKTSASGTPTDNAAVSEIVVLGVGGG